mgnify:CR=1 FL=1
MLNRLLVYFFGVSNQRFCNIAIMRLRFKQIRVLLFHALFWTAVWFFFVYFFSYNSVDTAYAIWFSSCLLPLTIMLTYYVVYKLIPGFLLTRKYLKFFLYSFYTLVFSSYFIVLAIYACLIFLLDFNIAIMTPMSKNFLFILILVYLIVVLVSFVSVLNHNFKTDSRNRFRFYPGGSPDRHGDFCHRYYGGFFIAV